MNSERRKILLIEPPFYRLFKSRYSLDRFPLSLGYLAGAIRGSKRWDVMAYNADFHPRSELMKVGYLTGPGFENYLNSLKEPSGEIWSEVRSVLEEYTPSIVGISAKSQNFASARMVARLVKEMDERIVVVMGGPHPSMLGGKLLDYPEIDIVVRGEGEKTITELLAAIEKRDAFDDVRGISFRKGGRIVENPQREFIQDLDKLDFPHTIAPAVLRDYSSYPSSAFQFVFATRGCPYDCFFCGSRKIWSRKVRFRSVDNVIGEIESLRKLGLRYIHFDDDTFGVTKAYIRSLCNVLIERCPGLRWSCEVHGKLVDDEIMSLMKASGCYSVQIGIESGNNEILAAMKKNITIEEASAACEIIKKHGISVEAFFIVGFPQETEETLQDTVNAMKELHCDRLSYSIFTPYPGTEAYEFCKERGLIDERFDESLYYHQSPANCFCMNISPERFRVLAGRIERLVDRKNKLSRIKRIFSANVFKKIRERGIAESIKRGKKLLCGR
ncbi:MAG: radical SAM protein [bacterium]|nr:MAG: radical SAM protein [bacterium]